MEGKATFAGTLKARKLSGKAPLSWKLKNNLRWPYISGWLGYKLAKPLSKLTGLTTLQGKLSVVHISGNPGHRTDYGVVSRRLVTEAFCTFMVD